MPQLDILIFKFENFHFMLSFFLFFFLNQYFVFPSIVRNITLRRKLITRSLINEKEVLFFLSLIKNFNLNKMDNLVFSISISDLRLILSVFTSSIFEIFSQFIFLKQGNYDKIFKTFSSKISLVVFVNEISNEKFQLN